MILRPSDANLEFTVTQEFQNEVLRLTPTCLPAIAELFAEVLMR